MTSGDSVRAPDSPVVASVLPLIPAWRVDRVFDYSVPDELSDKVDIGSLVRVPFGNRRVRAIVIQIQSQSELGSIDGLEAVIAAVIAHPVIPESLIPLFFWIADRYASQYSHVFGRAVPPRVRMQIEEPDPIAGGPGPQRTLSYRGG
nr:hypothetical protein [Actinomycetota bacterium]